MASKSKSRRRVFRASCILAALIVAGSSFAWFSSKDEVTNRLSASANYGVSIVEDFQPPKNFLPGQKVNKDVAVVNTGNVDAFVRTWIDGEMSLVKKSAWDDSTAANAGAGTITNFSTGLQKTADDQTKLTGVNLNWYKDGKYYKELSQIKSENPLNSTTSTTAADEGTNQLARFSEVQSIQAGGVLVYHDVAATDPDTTASAEYYYVLEQATTITNNAGVTATYPAGTYVCTPNSCVKDEAGAVIIPYNYYGNIDTSLFYPETEGLYLFRRNVKETGAANAVDDYEYTGYYFFPDGDKNETTATAKADDIDGTDVRRGGDYNPVYLALCYDTSHTQRSDCVLPDTALTTRTTDPTKDEVLPVTLNEVKLYTATEKVLKSYVEDGTVTYTVGGNEVTVSPDDTISGYTHKVVIGETTYYGTSDSGTFKKYDSGSGEVVEADPIQVVKTTGTKLDWTYTPYAAATSTTYKFDDNTTLGVPTEDTDNAPYTGYTWRINDGGTAYWSAAKTGLPYYAESDIDAVTGITPGAVQHTVTEVAGTAATGGVLAATYGTEGQDDYIKVNVQLANLDNAPTASTAETWSVIENVDGNDKKWTFYYNNDVEEGASTTKLIDYVELDKDVKDEAFLAFDFDLNVFMESVQVVLDESGNETCDPIVNPWANPSTTENNTNANYNAAKGTKIGTSAEIESITWAPYSAP